MAVFSKRNDIAYYSKIDDKFLLRFYNFGNYDENPVLFDFKYIHTFKELNITHDEILKAKLPYKTYIGESNFIEDPDNLVFDNLELRKLDEEIKNIEKKKEQILSSI
jgi:hypothetical protein